MNTSDATFDACVQNSHVFIISVLEHVIVLFQTTCLSFVTVYFIIIYFIISITNSDKRAFSRPDTPTMKHNFGLLSFFYLEDLLLLFIHKIYIKRNSLNILWYEI